MTTPWTPTVAVQAGAGAGATAAVTGDDSSGSVTVTTGTSPAAGELAVVSFGEPFTTAPQIVLIQIAGAWLNVTGTSTETTLTISAAEVPVATTEYTFAYQLSPTNNANLPAGLTGVPFFTPTDLAYRLQIDPGAINTDLATQLAQLASDAVREDLWLQVDYIENDEITLWGDNSEVLSLPQRPVTAVSSVTLAGTPMVPIQTGDPSSPMYDWRPSGTLRRVASGGSTYTSARYCAWPLGVPVCVTYSHGWQTAPSGIKDAALELAAGAYSNPEMHDSGRIGWVEWGTTHIALNLNLAQRASLDYYRRLLV